MPAIEVRISAGIFLLSFTYWSNWLTMARRSASTSAVGVVSGTIGITFAVKCVAPSSICSMRARCAPSTSTFTVPSGSLSICRMLATQPIS